MKERIMKEIWTNYEGDIKGTWRKYENNWKYMFKKKEKTCHLCYSGWVLQVGIFRSLADPRILASLAPFSEVCRCALTYTVDVGNIMKFIINGEATGPRTRGTKNARRNRLDTDFRMWVKWITCRPPSFHCVSRLNCHSGLTTPANHTCNRPLKWPKCLKFPTHISWSDVSWSWCTLQTHRLPGFEQPDVPLFISASSADSR